MEDAPAEGEIAVAALVVARVDDLVLEGREGTEGLERRAGLERAARRLVEHGPERVGVELVEALADAVATGAAGEVVRVEVRLAVHREQAARPHVDHDGRASGVRAHRALDRLHEVDVDREPEVASRERLLARRCIEQALGLGPGSIATARIDDPLLPAALPAQVALPRALDTRSADDVARVVAERVRLEALLGRHRLPALRAEARERLGVDLGGVADRVRGEVLVRVVADRLAHHLAAGDLGGVLLELGDDVAREILTDEDGAPAGRVVLVGRARVLDAGGEARALVGVQAERVGDTAPRVDLVGQHDDRPVRLLGPRARHHAAGNDEHVERRTARCEHTALGIADDAAGRRDGDATDHVLVRRLGVFRALHDLELKEAHADDAEREKGNERHPAVPLPELADVRTRDEERAHTRPPVSFGDPDIVTWWTRCAMRKTSGATAPVARTWGSAMM